MKRHKPANEEEEETIQEESGSASEKKYSQIFEDYCRGQSFFSTEAEWEQFFAALSTDLPTTFRINANNPEFAGVIRERLRAVAATEEHLVQEDEHAEPKKVILHPLPWYPGENAWYINASQRQLKRSSFKEMHQFLRNQSEQGNISWQEAVSMIPTLLLDVKENASVLDMCASPGSKTKQILELVTRNDSNDGLVVANDADLKRAYMLVNQVKRLDQGCAITTNYQGQNFPLLMASSNEQEQAGPVFFDRIMCDVPCSGDGMHRKASARNTARWNAHAGSNLHPLQLKIATRGAELLKVGGRMIYSTCSFNPVEDEAVVAELLRKSEGALELVDVSEELPQLKRRPGLTTWKVMIKQSGKFYWASRPEELPAQSRNAVVASCFPPAQTEHLHLERCIRIFPHLQDTGGFFVAVLKKTKEMPISSIPTSSSEAEAPRKRSGRHQLREEPFLPISERMKELWQHISNFYGIMESFSKDQLMARSEEEPNIVYIVSPAVKNILWHAHTHDTKLQIVNTGVRVLSKHARKKDERPKEQIYRLTQEGLPYIFPFITKRVIAVTLEDCWALLTSEKVPFSDLSDTTASALREIGFGGCVFTVKIPPTEESGAAASELGQEVALAGFRSVETARLLINKEILDSYRALLQLHGQGLHQTQTKEEEEPQIEKQKEKEGQ
ncbi:tRNA (cytosine(34)-C(5))-methyltransferase [Balamuthia mandrillaris]